MSTLCSRANVVSKDGAVVISWHPRRDIPYDKTKPLPHYFDVTNCHESPLKVQFDHTSRPTIQDVAASLCKSSRTLKPKYGILTRAFVLLTLIILGEKKEHIVHTTGRILFLGVDCEPWIFLQLWAYVPSVIRTFPSKLFKLRDFYFLKIWHKSMS
ncbi:unnamed protein product [Mesocestoides corti]|uniref:39S ribosomal protein L42, mitochondrial n=1 Tax=Mesocestoides corti TaxID=53468 RepID=A0A0R3UI91_MESCO|nr:unnamed protein product [Mesocestoides corti]